ncbi:MAG: TonB family protein [Gammaproteobacteria bacterium]
MKLYDFLALSALASDRQPVSDRDCALNLNTRNAGSRPLHSIRLHLTGEENPARLFGELVLLVLLLHVYLLAYFHKPSERETPAKPLVMDVALIAPSSATPRAKAAPPMPLVAQPKRRQAPLKPKKTPLAAKPANPPARSPEPTEKRKTAPPDASADAVPPSDSAVATTASRQPQTETFTEANYRANYKSNPKPEYPRIALSRGWQGKVLLRVRVTASGQSDGIAVQQSSGYKQLDQAAIKAVRFWTFIPAKRGERPVASTVTVPIQFKLNE